MVFAIGLMTLATVAGGGDKHDVNRYALVDYQIDLDERSKVGTRRAGITCFPAGTYHWRDVRPDARDTEKALKLAMRDADPVRFALPDRLLEEATGRPDYRVRATLIAFDMAGCSKQWMFGRLLHRRDMPVSGKASVTVKWEVAVPGTGSVLSSQILQSDLNFENARDLGREVVTAALIGNAGRFVAMIDAAPPAP